jgi:hypothetical protein
MRSLAMKEVTTVEPKDKDRTSGGAEYQPTRIRLMNEDETTGIRLMSHEEWTEFLTGSFETKTKRIAELEAEINRLLEEGRQMKPKGAFDGPRLTDIGSDCSIDPATLHATGSGRVCLGTPTPPTVKFDHALNAAGWQFVNEWNARELEPLSNAARTHLKTILKACIEVWLAEQAKTGGSDV